MRCQGKSKLTEPHPPSTPTASTPDLNSSKRMAISEAFADTTAYKIGYLQRDYKTRRVKQGRN